MSSITEFFSSRFPEVSPHDFYRELFPSGSLEKKGEFVDGKYCAIAVQIVSATKAKRYSVTDDLTVIDDLTACNDFCVMSPISYAGKSQKQSHARFMYALTIDLDDIKHDDQGEPVGLDELWYRMTDIKNTAAAEYAVPKPTYIVASGHGVHLYYFFKKPIPLYRNVIEQLSVLRHELVRKIWNSYVTNLWENRQYESVTQSFRMVGTITKTGVRVKAYRTGSRVDMDYLNSYVREEFRVHTYTYSSSMSLDEAKKKYPDWYERRVVQQQPRGSWTNKRDLYEWWKRRIPEVLEGHRYFAVMALAIYAQKCAIPRDELEQDAYALVDSLNAIGNHQDTNPFTVDDVSKALEAYNADYQTFPRKNIEKLTAIRIDPNKRNGRKQAQHLRIARATLAIMNEGLESNLQGRPAGSGTKREIVQQWRAEHPQGKKIECQRQTGLSRPTVLKWWKIKLKW
ncbi:hypothetical protein [Alloscardovia criceti]|uniref:hypothetical protein n=1 Tax=Alloscardovia criceti TaxID=356828 RepID=UPI00037CDCC0|nr:hypothetical protein [Alloscardovia criceti]